MSKEGNNESRGDPMIVEIPLNLCRRLTTGWKPLGSQKATNEHTAGKT